MRVRIWGVRGSVPAARPTATRHGGNTPCVEVETAAGVRLVLDAGTGLHWLGRHLMAAGFAHGQGRAHLLLTHTHWAHIQGLPFCGPLLVAGNRFTLHGPADGPPGLDALLAVQMRQVYCPVPDFLLEGVGARVEVTSIGEGEFDLDGARVRARRLHHAPGVACLGYRLEADGAALAYLPDVEYLDESHRLPALELAQGADLVLHDAHCTAAEYRARPGRGHASDADAVAMARQAGAARLLLFHHHPDRTDAELDAVVAAHAGASLPVAAAREGSEMGLGRRG